MGEVSTVGLDIAKSIFQAHGADDAGAIVFRKKLSRGRLLAFFASLPPCVVAMEACAGAHHWGSSLGPRAGEAGAHGSADPAGLREAVRQTAEERRG
jgi:hypothetical protein